MEKSDSPQTIALTVEIGKNHYIRDVRTVQRIDELVYVIQAYIGTGSKIEAIEIVDNEIKGFYTKILSEDDIDSMEKEWSRDERFSC